MLDDSVHVTCTTLICRASTTKRPVGALACVQIENAVLRDGHFNMNTRRPRNRKINNASRGSPFRGVLYKEGETPCKRTRKHGLLFHGSQCNLISGPSNLRINNNPLLIFEL